MTSLWGTTSASAVAGYYASRQDAPIWLRGGETEATSELVAILRRAPIEGLSIGPQLASQIEAAAARARSGNVAASNEAERLMSIAWVLYVQTIQAPTSGMIYGDTAMRPTMLNPEQILAQASRARSLVGHLRTASQVNPVYSALRDAAWADASASGAVSDKLVANLDRARALPATGRFVVVDAAAARLWMYENGAPVDSMKVIVGKPELPTPMIASMIHYATFKPYWHVPDHLIRKNVAPNVIKQGAGYLRTRGYHVVSDWNDDAAIVPPDKVDWAAVAAGRTTVKIRQDPGATNSMGAMKFAFANGEGIYLHDTPEKALFAKDQRTLSNGCVRLEDAPRFAQWLMGSVPQIASTSPEQHIQLRSGVPIYITYMTAHADGGRLTYSEDVYGRDTSAGARVAALR
ncbi:MAG: L,D-transpeptidase family protein [Sphingomonas bacterium]|nr:L,D-transpeptidase family protein [Sphingomonas bacterium]